MVSSSPVLRGRQLLDTTELLLNGAMGAKTLTSAMPKENAELKEDRTWEVALTLFLADPDAHSLGTWTSWTTFWLFSKHDICHKAITDVVKSIGWQSKGAVEPEPVMLKSWPVHSDHRSQ